MRLILLCGLSELCCLGCLAEIPEGMICNISHDCANSFIKQLLEKQMWPKVLLLLTGKANGEAPSGGGLFKNCSLTDVDIGNIIQQFDKSDEQVHLIRCLIERGGEKPCNIDVLSQIRRFIWHVWSNIVPEIPTYIFLWLCLNCRGLLECS